jgi:CDP-diacylglycerol--glycerol-3-phosphate 3-phosphatidyltransferase
MTLLHEKLFSIPNSLSLLRLTLVPLLVFSAIYGYSQMFLWILGVCLVSDVLDGYFARKLQQVSTLGAKLDSWGDALTYASMIFGLYRLWPLIFSEQGMFLLCSIMSFVVPLAAALLKFGEYPSYHTWGAKLAAVLIAPAYYLLILLDADVWFRFVIILYLLVAIEEIAITLTLTSPKTNVSSVITLIQERRRIRN